MPTKTKKRKRKLDLAKVKKLSTLLEIGLRDLRKQERAKNCVVRMDVWWHPRQKRGEECQACLAGSVMKHSLGMPPKVHSYISPISYSTQVCGRLSALNSLRNGAVSVAARHMKKRSDQFLKFDRGIASYDIDRDQWWSDMKKLLSDLKAAGE